MWCVMPTATAFRTASDQMAASSFAQECIELSSRNKYLLAMRVLAKKYKAMGLPVQRRNAVEDAIFWRRVLRCC